MGWATQHIERLQTGEQAVFRPHGNSMTGRIESGQLCTVAPLTKHTELQIGDVVLCKVGGKQYLHLIKDVNGNKYLIGNNHGRINGWTDRRHIYGRLISVE